MLFLAALLPAMAHAQTTDKVLQRIRDTKKVTIAYRTDAKPFSHEENGQPAGYTVELCKRSSPASSGGSRSSPCP